MAMIAPALKGVVPDMAARMPFGNDVVLGEGRAVVLSKSRGSRPRYENTFPVGPGLCKEWPRFERRYCLRGARRCALAATCLR